MQPGLRERWMHHSMFPSCRTNFKNHFIFMTKPLPISSSSKTMIPNTPANWPRIGSKTMGLLSWSGLHSHLTLILLNIFGTTSKRSLMSMKILLTVYMSFGRGWKGSGMQWTSLFVRDWLRVYLGMLQQYWKPRKDTPNTSLWHFFTFKSWATKPFQWCACTNYVIMFPNLDVISHK